MLCFYSCVSKKDKKYKTKTSWNKVYQKFSKDKKMCQIESRQFYLALFQNIWKNLLLQRLVLSRFLYCSVLWRKSKIERRSVGEDRHYEFLISPMDYSTVASEDRTSEWILTEGGQKQINSGNLMYQKWASNAAQNMTAAGMMTSKLNPECKPFSPTRKYNKQGKV